jgi:hypothetical protein
MCWALQPSLRLCHGGAYAKEKVQTTCIACHDYHQSATLKMGKL